ncbi:MAG: LacI family DNA-binding transcriptional regulator [Actinophytocola sp.]|uniref:LacI family DNA-binding transcriptional regulator n=1 Tax=Actinophytocola sp. TaxID=1872138 RepID=UPI001327CE04|nr:LacI family DNA-binding transcriptional regulator [Actinophytocola sp.]MPZ82695.1 LacI family DNA-binding transcriptional regulator [Actinophytocola sp.]
MRVSITDVARQAGVTPAVVSRVLNADPKLQIRAETRDRVLAAARELDYTPSHAARALRHSRAGALGLAVHDMANPLYGEIILGAQKAAADAGFVLLLADIDGLARGDDTFHRVVYGGAIDGLLLQRAGTASDRTIIGTASARIPTVLLNDRSTTLASVALDDLAGSRMATQHLLDLGHTRIAHLKIGGTQRSGNRVRGWRDALARAGLTPNPSWLVAGGHTVESGLAGMRSLLSRRPLPTAVVVGNVLAAIGALTAAREAGLDVPGRLSVVAFHDVLYAAHLTPALTAVAMPLRELGAAAVTLLMERLEGNEPRHVVVRDPAPVLVTRGSTAPPAS